MELSTEGKQGRTIIARFKPGQELVLALTKFLQKKHIRACYIPVLLGGFKNLKMNSMTFGKSEDEPKQMELEYRQPLDYFGNGTIAQIDDKPSIHIHLVAAQSGNKPISGHLVSGEIVLTTEIVIVEIEGAKFTRKPDREIFNYSLLYFK